MNWKKEFDKATKDMVIIFPKAFVEDAKKYGFSTTIDLNQLLDLKIAKRAIKAFISTLLEKQEKEMKKGIRQQFKKAIVKKIVLPNGNTILLEVSKEFFSALKGKE